MENPGIYYRQIPEEFADIPGIRIERNNVYDQDGNLLTQLEEAISHTEQIPQDYTNLFTNILSYAGHAASIINLGVCTVGFLHISKGLRRIEDRLQGIDQKLDEIQELVGVVDFKIDQLLDLNETQLASLQKLFDLIASQQLAEVHAALEVLEIRTKQRPSKKRDEEILDATNVLHVHRTWLFSQLDSDNDLNVASKAEIMRFAVLIVLAEVRARCLVDDVDFAIQALIHVRERLVNAVTGMFKLDYWESALSNGMVEEYLKSFAWLKGVGVDNVTNSLLLHVKSELDLYKPKYLEARTGFLSDDFDSVGVALDIDWETIYEDDEPTECLEPKNFDTELMSCVSSARLVHNVDQSILVLYAIASGVLTIQDTLSSQKSPETNLLVAEIQH